MKRLLTNKWVIIALAVIAGVIAYKKSDKFKSMIDGLLSKVGVK